MVTAPFSSTFAACLSADQSHPMAQKRSMVDMELVAARALTDLATGTTANADGKVRGNDYEPERVSATKRSRNLSPPNGISADSYNTEHLNEDNMVDHQHLDQFSSEVNKSSTCDSSLRGRSRVRQKLSESEKEAKKLRRILANRESARETIRRRQAIREELDKKFANLTSENKKIEKEKELVMKEYILLKDENEQLKEQVAKTFEDEIETNSGKNRETRVTVSDEESAATKSFTQSSLIVSDKSSFKPYVSPFQPSIHTQIATKSPNISQGLLTPPRNFQFIHEVCRSSGSPNVSFAVAKAVSVDIKQVNSKASQKEVDKGEKLPRGNTIVKGKETKERADTGRNHIASIAQLGLKSSSFSGSALEKGVVSTANKSDENLQCHPQEKVSNAAAAAEARKKRKELMKLKFIVERQVAMNQ